MKKLILSLLFLASPLLANGPLYVSPSTQDQLEHQNIYKDLRFPKISTGTAQNFYIVNGSGTAFNISSGTVTNLTAKTITLSPSGTLTGVTGRILNITQDTETSAASTSAGTFQATNLSIPVTPTSTSSKFLLFMAMSMQSAAVGTNCEVTMARNGTNLGAATGLMATNSVTNRVPGAAMYLDSPATTSSITYDVRILSDGGASVTVFQNQPGIFIVAEYL